LVRIDNVTEEELDEAVRRLEEEERWQKENPEKHRLITQLWTTIFFLEKMIAELRGK
jgi:uncharacterized protein YqcC (DUF446 family)